MPSVDISEKWRYVAPVRDGRFFMQGMDERSADTPLSNRFMALADGGTGAQVPGRRTFGHPCERVRSGLAAVARFIRRGASTAQKTIGQLERGPRLSPSVAARPSVASFPFAAVRVHSLSLSIPMRRICQAIARSRGADKKSMISTSRKVTLLLKAGVTVPPFPTRRLPVQERYLREGVRVPQEELDADAEQRLAVVAWSDAVSRLFATHLAKRVAGS